METYQLDYVYLAFLSSILKNQSSVFYLAHIHYSAHLNMSFQDTLFD